MAQILVRLVDRRRVLVYRVVGRLARVSVEVRVVAVAGGRRTVAGTGGSSGAAARSAAAAAHSARVQVRELGGQVDRTVLARLQRQRPVLDGRVEMFGLGETGRVHDRHVDVRYQVQMDHVVVLLEESPDAAAGDATDAAPAATAADAAAVRSGRLQVVGRQRRRPQLVVLFADHGPVVCIHFVVKRFVFRKLGLEDLRRLEQRPPRSWMYNRRQKNQNDRLIRNNVMVKVRKKKKVKNTILVFR